MSVDRVDRQFAVDWVTEITRQRDELRATVVAQADELSRLRWERDQSQALVNAATKDLEAQAATIAAVRAWAIRNEVAAVPRWAGLGLILFPEGWDAAAPTGEPTP